MHHQKKNNFFKTLQNEKKIITFYHVHYTRNQFFLTYLHEKQRCVKKENNVEVGLTGEKGEGIKLYKLPDMKTVTGMQSTT